MFKQIILHGQRSSYLIGLHRDVLKRHMMHELSMNEGLSQQAVEMYRVGMNLKMLIRSEEKITN